MKLDTAPITVATTALTIPAIAPWEAEKKKSVYIFQNWKQYVKLVLSQSRPCEHFQKTINWNYYMQL